MMTLKKILETCRQLRSAYERSEVKFFLALVDVEEKHLQVVLDAGHDSFESFVERNHLCRVGRYTAFRAGLKHTTAEKAERFGVHAVAEIAHIEKKNLTKFETAISAWVSEYGVAPSRETAKYIRRQIEPREQVPRVVTTASMVGRLRAELQETKAALAAAQKRVKELEAQIAGKRKAG